MRVCNNDGTAVRGKRIDIVNSIGYIKILIDDALDAFVNGQVDVISNRRLVQCPVEGIREVLSRLKAGSFD